MKSWRIRDKAKVMRAAAKVAKNRQLEINAVELRMNAERIVGKMIEAQKATVGLATGGQPYQQPTGTRRVPVERPTLAEAGIDKKLSGRAQKLAAIPDEKWEGQELPDWRRQQEQSPVVVMYQPGRSPADRVMLNRAASKGLDLYCTPPYVTRALFEHILLPVLGKDYDFGTVWDPCCGLGHMSEVLKEYASPVFASDIYDYGFEQDAVIDFLNARSYRRRPNWVIGNSPYKFALEFVLQGLQVARKGVAFVNRLYFGESKERYYKLFSSQPPSYTGWFNERFGMQPGFWSPDLDGSLATYAWFVWIKPITVDESRNRYIPPTCRELLTRPEDRRLAERKFSAEEPIVVEAAE